MEYIYIKALHIIFVVCWFAALFYIVRLFIYASEAHLKPEPARGILIDQFRMMQKKLWYIIGWPSMLGTVTFGVWMIVLNPGLLSMPWMWLKLIFVGLLVVYHFECQRILKKHERGEFALKTLRLRLFNELATVFLVAIVFLAVVKSQDGLLWGILGLIAFAAMLMVAVTVYKKNRDRNLGKNTDSIESQGDRKI